MRSVIDPVYMPFTEQEVNEHFRPTNSAKAFVESAKRYHDYMDSGSHVHEKRTPEAFRARQMEKDEKFWTVTTLMSFFRDPDTGAERDPDTRARMLTQLMERRQRSCDCASPSVPGITSWDECFNGDLELIFEPKLPTPPDYNDWLAKNLEARVLIPYLIEAAQGLGDEKGSKQQWLEGSTWPDAAIMNPANGFTVVFESKVVSDVASGVRYDSMRNQITRLVDVLLEEPEKRESGFLKSRRPDRTLLVLLTPRIYQERPSSRLYGYVMNEYMQHPQALQRDIPYRPGIDWPAVCKRLGWLTWEDCKEVLPGRVRG